MGKIVSFDKMFERFIVFTVFVSPFSNIVIFRTGIADLRLIQGLWLIVLSVLMIKKAGSKQWIVSDQPLRKRNFNISIVLYLLAIIISCLYSIDISWSLKELFQYIYLVIIMCVIYHLTKDNNLSVKIIKALVAANILLVCISIASYITKVTIIPSFYITNSGIFVNRNSFSTNTLMETGQQILRLNGILGLGATAIANQILIQSLFVNYMFRKASGKMKIFYLLLLAGNLVTMVMTYSRAGILVFIVIHIVTLMSKNQLKNIFIVLFTAVICYCLLMIFPTVLLRVLETFNTEERSSKYHFAIWLIALKTGLSNLWTGIGIGNMAFNYDLFAGEFYRFGIEKTNAVNVHSYVLQIWSEQGLPGLIANFLLLIYPIFYYLKFRFLKNAEKTIYDFIFLAYIATLTYNLTNNNFYIETFWILAGLIYFAKDNLISIHNKDILKGGIA